MTSVGTSAPDGALAGQFGDWACERAVSGGGDVETVVLYRFSRDKPPLNTDESIEEPFEQTRRSVLLERACR